MGAGAGTGFDYLAQAGAQAGLQGIQHKRQMQDEQRQTELQVNMGIMNDPAATPDMKAQAHQNIQGLYPTPEHRGTFLNDVFHIHDKKQAAAQAQQPSQAPANPIGDAGSSYTPAASPVAKDELGVPYSSGPPSQAAPAATTPPPPSTTVPQPQPNPQQNPLAAAGAASTPQAAMDLWKQYRGPTAINEEIAQNHAKAAAGYAQALEAQRAQAAIDLAKTRGNMGIGITPENRFLNQYAAQHGFGSAAEMNADETGEAMKAYRASNATPGWKAVMRGNDIYAVDSHNPSDPGRLVGNKDNVVINHAFATLTNPDGSTYKVPITTYTEKGSNAPALQTVDEQSAAPVSANTPQGPSGSTQAPASAGTPSAMSPSPAATPQPGAPVSSATPQGVPGAQGASANPGARQPGSKPAGAAVKGSKPLTPFVSIGAPIPFGGKPSELSKSDTSQYTKLAEDANSKQEALQLAQMAARSPSPSSDQQLIYSWVRANVQGAGRMTQAEFNQAARIGSLGQKAQTWYSMATTGKMTPEIRQMMLADIKNAAMTSQQAAQTARDQVQQDMAPQGRTPKSKKTPSGPSAAPKTAADYLKSIGAQ